MQTRIHPSPCDSAPRTRWSILYRGPLTSCNYACGYCPFAKTRNTWAELEHDAACLRRFVSWVASRTQEIGILLTPWGEAMVHEHYQEAMIELSHLPHVWRIAAQTNLSFKTDWLEACDKRSTALWCTYHPTETTVDRFLTQCAKLQSLGVKHSVGVVGTKESFADIETLRAALPADTYLWVNAWKRQADYYTDDETARLLQVDPLFQYNLHPHASEGKPCRAGHTAFTVDGAGDVRRCHFIAGVIGNIHDPDFAQALVPRSCTNAECRCHIGYVHMPELKLDEHFGEGLLERIPAGWPQRMTSSSQV